MQAGTGGCRRCCSGSGAARAVPTRAAPLLWRPRLRVRAAAGRAGPAGSPALRAEAAEPAAGRATSGGAAAAAGALAAAAAAVVTAAAAAAAALPPAAAADALQPFCFDAACSARADAALVAALAAPLLAAAAAGAWVLRPPPKDLVDQGRIFEDPTTGTLFEAPEGVAPEVDKNELLAFRPVSYTPWPVASDAPGERVRVPVGKVGATEPRTYVIEKQLPAPSEILCVTLPRPLGIVFKFDEARKRALVDGFVPGGHAEQRRKVARLNSEKASQAAFEGDVLRAVTCTCPVWPTKALFGAVAPERHIVLYGADRTKWSSLRGALKRGAVRDGPVTLVLERRMLPDEPRQG